MSIRTDLELDITSYKKSLNEADAAAIKYARNQEQNFRKQQKEMKAIETELNRLRKVREASNNPKAIRRYTQAIEKLEQEQEQLRKKTQKYSSAVNRSSKTTESAFKRIGRSAKMWLAGTAAGAILTITSLARDMGGEMMRFNEEMNKSLAIQGDVTMEQRKRMEEAAKSVSLEMNMATDEVAKGYYYLASAGLDVEEQIANLPKVAEFAKAGMFDLATATDLATDAQSALGMTVEDTSQNKRNLVRVTDTLVSANQQANATVQQFSEALTNRGATALKNVNKEVEEGTAVLAAYADQGIKGRRAGEYLSRTLRIMAKAANENKEEFKELGIVTEEGNLADFPTIIEALTEELDGLSDTAMTAKLEKMGFTSEVQEAIKPLLGLSDAIAEYEKELRQAAGSTEEVADKQMKSLTERLASLKRQLIDTFGDDVLSAIELTVNMLEDLYEGIRGTQEELRQESVIEGALQDIGGLTGSDMTGWGFQNLRQELQSLYDAQRNNTEEFNRQNRELADNIESYSTWASEVEGAKQKVADANEELQFREMVLKRNIERNKELIESEETSAEKKAKLSVRNEFLNRKLQSVQEALDSTRKHLSQTTEEEEKQEQKVSELADTYISFQDSIENLSLGNIGEIQGGLTDAFVSDFDMAAGYVERYKEALTEANNELKTGAIDQQEYEERVQSATDSFLSQVKKIYKSVKDDLTPAQEEAWSTILDTLPDVNEETEETKTNLADLADTADAILNVADAFGQIGDQARKSLRGISDVLRNVEKLKGASGFGAVVPAIGVAGGVATMLSGLFDNSEEKKRQAELASSMKELQRAVEENTEAFYQESVVGSDISQEQIDRGRQLTSGLMEEWESIDWWEFIEEGEESNMSSIRDRLSELGEMFPEIFGEHLEMFNNYIEQGDPESAIQLLQDIPNQFQEIADSVGEYGDSIRGAAKTFRDAIRYGGATVEEAFDQAADHILNNVATMEELDREAINLIEEAQSLDLSTEEGKERLKEIVKILFENPQWRGDMTKEEWEEMLDLFLDASDESATGSESGDEFSRSAEIARSITDVQANEIIMFLERIEKWTRDTAAQLGSEVAIDVNASGGLMPDIDIPVPLPVELINDKVPVEIINEISGRGDGGNNGHGGGSGNGDTDGGGDGIGGDGDPAPRQQKSMNVNVGGVQVGRENISDEEIEEIGRRFTQKLKRQIRGSQF